MFMLESFAMQKSFSFVSSSACRFSIFHKQFFLASPRDKVFPMSMKKELQHRAAQKCDKRGRDKCRFTKIKLNKLCQITKNV